MAASASDYFQKVSWSTATTLSSPGYTAGVSTSINVGSTAEWETSTGITFGIDEVDSAGLRVSGTYNVFRGTVASATQIDNLVYVGGNTERSYSAGATTRVYILVSKYRENRMVDGLTLNVFDQDATLKAGAVDNVGVFASGVISTTAPFSTALNPTTHLDETTFDFVASGCVWSGDAYASTRNASMTAGVVYIGGVRVPLSVVTARSFTASRDTYIDVDNAGTIYYTEVTNNASSPSTTTVGSISRTGGTLVCLGIIITGASNIADVGSVNQGQEDKVLPIASSIAYAVTDSLGNLICPHDPNRKLLGYRQILGNATATAQADVAGLTVPVLVPDGSKVKIIFDSTGMSINAVIGAGSYSLYIMEGGTQLAVSSATSTGSGHTSPMHREAQPAGVSSGLHTYKIQTSGGGGTATLVATSTSPAFIRVERA